MWGSHATSFCFTGCSLDSHHVSRKSHELWEADRETKTNNCVSYQNDTLKIESENKKWDDDGTTFAPRQSVHHKNWISI